MNKRRTWKATVFGAVISMASTVLFGTGTATAVEESEPPDTPTNLRVTDLQANTVTVAWDASSGADEYWVGVDGPTWYPGRGGFTEELSHTIYVEQGSSYGVVVRAHGPGGPSALTERLKFTTPIDPDNPPVTTPTGVEAHAFVDDTGTNVTVSWDASEAEVGPILYIVDVRFSRLQDTYYSDTSRVTFDARPDTAYEIRVRARDGVNRETAWTETLRITTPVLEAPAPPAHVRAQPSPGSVVLSWDAAVSETAIKDYRVRIGNRQIFTEKTSLTWEWPPGGDFEATVEARDVEHQWGAPSDLVSFSVAPHPDWTAPTAPTDLRASFDDNGQLVLVEWDAATGGVGELTYSLNIEGFGTWDRTKELFLDFRGYPLFARCEPGESGAESVVTATSFGVESPPSNPITLCFS